MAKKKKKKKKVLKKKKKNIFFISPKISELHVYVAECLFFFVDDLFDLFSFDFNIIFMTHPLP
jgi:hypothetical protein